MAGSEGVRDQRDVRIRVLESCGAGAAAAEELLAVNQCRLDPARAAEPPRQPLADEPHLEAWRRYDELARTQGAWSVLAGKLVQLRFPIRAGISQMPEYLAAVRRGEFDPDAPSALALQQADLLELDIHRSLGGALPILFTPDRADFVALVQALAGRNEPIPVPDSMGACLISGLVNWDRVQTHRAAWEAAPGGERATRSWADELRRLAARKELIQDRLVLLSRGPYSNVPAAALGLEEEAWLRRSLAIRREHECAHYFTLRLFGALQHNVLEEVVADLVGLVRGAGGYEPDLALRFLGLEEHPRFREGGRLANYRGRPPVSDGAFEVLREVTFRAVRGLASSLRDRPGLMDGDEPLANLVAALVPMTIEELASESLPEILDRRLARIPHP